MTASPAPSNAMLPAEHPRPIEMGGFADVLTFPKYVRGKTYVTADCTGPATSQLRTRLGNYELMICTRKPSVEAADFISKLAPYAFQAKLQPGDTMEFPRRQAGSTLKGLVFTHPGDEPLSFEFLGKHEPTPLSEQMRRATSRAW